MAKTQVTGSFILRTGSRDIVVSFPPIASKESQYSIYVDLGKKKKKNDDTPILLIQYFMLGYG